DLRAFGNNAVAVFSDYGGESTGSYHTYSTLVCGYGYTGLFGQRMKAVREKHTLGGKEIAFKKFGNGPLRRALPEYLAALDNLPGLLCTLAVDKRVTTLFGPQEKSTMAALSRILEAEGLGRRKAHVTEKLLRIVHFTAFLTALLAHNGQKIFWMTDNDASCANREAHQQLLILFERVLSIYTRSDCEFPLIGGAVPFNPPSIEMMDLLSVPDVVAGCIVPCIPTQGSKPDRNAQVKRGADSVLRWHTQDGIGLKKTVFLIRLGAGGVIEDGSVNFNPVQPAQNATGQPSSAR